MARFRPGLSSVNVFARPTAVLDHCAAAFAGVSGGYSANLLIGSVDVLLSAQSQVAAGYKPVMPTFSPLATARVMVSMMASRASAAAFFPPSRPSRASTSCPLFTASPPKENEFRRTPRPASWCSRALARLTLTLGPESTCVQHLRTNFAMCRKDFKVARRASG